MNFFIFLIFLTMFIIFLNYFFKKNFFLISSTGDRHQKFTSSESIPLSGGIFIFLGILYSYDVNFLYFFIFSFLILILGFFSDLKLIKSAILRLIMQISLVILFVSITDLKIQIFTFVS